MYWVFLEDEILEEEVLHIEEDIKKEWNEIQNKNIYLKTKPLFKFT